MRLISLALTGLLVVGCCRDRCEMTRYHEDGRAKPVVLVPAIIDTSSFDAPWSVSEELTAELTDRFSAGGELYVASNEESYFTENPFGADLSWMKREFPGQEFVVFLELVEHEAVPTDKTKRDLPPQEISFDLNTAVRMRVIDLRGEMARIVLQETIRHSHFIPKALIPTNYNVVTWGTPEYEESAMKMAHAALVNEVAARVTDYILLAKSR